MDGSARMPVIFVGHGSPMNAIQENEFSKTWEEVGKSLPLPSCIVCVSAHWQTRGTFVSSQQKNETIYDFFGFPPELYALTYSPAGSPETAEKIVQLSKEVPIRKDRNRGIDHGAWSVLMHMFPQADIPYVQLSIDYEQEAAWHYVLANQLRPLREEGVLFVCSGNLVHNLSMIQLRSQDFNDAHAYDWAIRINEEIKTAILQEQTEKLIDYMTLDPDMDLAVPTPEHYLPLVFALALRNPKDQCRFFNDKVIVGSLSMTSVIFE